MDFDPRDYDPRDDDRFRLTDITEEKGITGYFRMM